MSVLERLSYDQIFADLEFMMDTAVEHDADSNDHMITPAMLFESPSDQYLCSLLKLVLQESWDEACSSVTSAAAAATGRVAADAEGSGRTTDNPSDDATTNNNNDSNNDIRNSNDHNLSFRLGVVLGAACLKPSVPLEFFQQCLHADRNVAMYQDGFLRTPLHMLMIHLGRPDLVQLLITSTPACIHVRDMEGLRPIDILTQRILMKEERFRYVGRQRSSASDDNTHSDSQEQQFGSLQDHWECARLLAMQHHGSLSRDTPLLHALLSAPGTPLSIQERAIRRFGHQLQMPDPSTGNLPLHCVAGRRRRRIAPPPNNDGDNHNNDATLDEDDDDYLLNEVLNRYREGVQKRNFEGQWPLDVAIEAGRVWETGIETLICAYPDAVANLANRIPLQQYSILLEALQHKPNGMTIILALIHANPDLTSRAAAATNTTVNDTR